MCTANATLSNGQTTSSTHVAFPHLRPILPLPSAAPASATRDDTTFIRMHHARPVRPSAKARHCVCSTPSPGAGYTVTGFSHPCLVPRRCVRACMMGHLGPNPSCCLLLCCAALLFLQVLHLTVQGNQQYRLCAEEHNVLASFGGGECSLQCSQCLHQC